MNERYSMKRKTQKIWEKKEHELKKEPYERKWERVQDCERDRQRELNFD